MLNSHFGLTQTSTDTSDYPITDISMEKIERKKHTDIIFGRRLKIANFWEILGANVILLFSCVMPNNRTLCAMLRILLLLQ